MSVRYRLLLLAWVGALLSFGTVSAAMDHRLLQGLSARAIGPAAVGGRITAIDALASDPNRIVIGAATGGVWMSDNGGLTWRAVFDQEQVASIGAVAINQSNPDIIWIGTGEGNVRNSTSVGGGIYKSIDGGRSWHNMGLVDSERINRIALHPRRPEVAYVAAMGTLWGENDTRGVYRTGDGGSTWERILYVDQRTGATDVKLHPSNPDKVYAAMWQFRRYPYHFKSGGPGSGLYLSYDGGNSWQRKSEEDGLPVGELGRMVIAPSPADPNRVYALVEAKKSALMRSDNGGESWDRVNQDFNIAIRPFYYTELAADPVNADRVYNIFTRLTVSIDGGKTFQQNAAIDCCAASNTIHIDNHALWINPSDPKHLIIGNDGGIAITRDRGDSWRFVRNLPLAQFYHIAVDNDHPYHVYGGLQDNGSWRGPAEVWENGGIRNLHWQEVGFGDGFDTVPDPRDSMQGYSMSQGGSLMRWNLATGELRNIRPSPPSEDSDLRFNWSAGFAIDPFQPDTIYYGSQFLHRSNDRGASWEVISQDLTSNNPEHQTFRDSGGLTPDVTAAENYTTIVSVAPSTLEQGTLWVGSDDGRVHITRDGGSSWSRVDERVRGLPVGAWVAMIHPSPHDAGTAFVVFDDHRRSNMETYVYRAENFGRRWQRLDDDSLRGYALSVLQDGIDPQLLFLGTEFGLFISTDGGEAWTPFTRELPTVSVMDMAIQQRENDLILGTHGRGVYIIDDYSALRGLTEADFDQRLALLAVTDAQQYDPVQTPSTRFPGSGEFRAANEPYGVLVTFMASGDDLPHPDEEAERQRKVAQRQLDDEPIESAVDGEGEDEQKDKRPKVELKVYDSAGELIRTRRYPIHQGINRIVWGLERDGVKPPPGPNPPNLDDGLPRGPEVPPGQYRLTLSFDRQEQSGQAEVLPDPRSPYSMAQRRQSYLTQVEVMNLRRQAVEALTRIAHTRQDIGTVLKLIEQREDDATLADDDKALRQQARELQKALNELEDRFRVRPQTKGIVYDDDRILSQIGLAQSYVGSSYDAPSPSALVYLERARLALRTGLEAVNELSQGSLSEFRQAAAASGIGLLQRREPLSVNDV